jgi:hypothetical protein
MMTNAASQVLSCAWLRRERAYRGTARVIFEEIAGILGAVDTSSVSRVSVIY